MEKGKTLNYMAPKIKTWSLTSSALFCASPFDGGGSTEQYGIGSVYDIDD